MNHNVLSIDINKPVADVFSFVIDPANTPKWIESLQKEEVNELPIGPGTIYRNVDQLGVWMEYVVSDFQQDAVFELVAFDGNYHVRYLLRDLGYTSTRMEYQEWMQTGELAQPFNLLVLSKLKEIMEK